MKNLYRLFSLSTVVALVMPTAASASLPSHLLQPRSAARDFGPVNPAQRISVTVHLKRPNEALFARTVDALYDRGSPTFHHWLTDAQLAQFGPPAAQVAAVRTELERNGLSVLSVSGDRTSIYAAGTVAAVSNTFHTAIHQFALNGTAFRANTSPATLAGAAGAYVASVSGLESHHVKPMLARAINLKTKSPYAAVPLSKVLAAGGLSSLINDTILGPQQTFKYTTGGTVPSAEYAGLSYDPYGNIFPDYTPAQLQGILGMPAAYAKGLNGAGQTIVLVEGYGYPTALADANAFSALTGLPQLNSTNFSVVYPEGKPNPEAGILEGWDVEIALDIAWSHSIAPGAKILVVATNGQDSQDFEASMQYIIDHHLGTAVSDSWEEDTDIVSGPAEQEGFEDVLIAAAAKGISFQFSSGDSGDAGLGTPVGAAGVPAVAPHATAVGGTSILNDPDRTPHRISLGWGTSFSFIEGVNEAGQTFPLQPGSEAFFNFGGGGGSSLFWPKPHWQTGVPGSYRQTPDVSALADPYTGVPLVVTLAGTQGVLYGVGGTSLASPIFTAMWAIATQRAGHPLGQAAPTIAGLKRGIVDVLPITAAFAAEYTDSSGTDSYYSADTLFSSVLQAYGSTQNVFATVWNAEPAAAAFGLDSSLTVTPGWDNVTGYGTPTNGLEFIEAAASY